MKLKYATLSLLLASSSLYAQSNFNPDDFLEAGAFKEAVRNIVEPVYQCICFATTGNMMSFEGQVSVDTCRGYGGQPFQSDGAIATMMVCQPQITKKGAALQPRTKPNAWDAEDYISPRKQAQLDEIKEQSSREQKRQEDEHQASMQRLKELERETKENLARLQREADEREDKEWKAAQVRREKKIDDIRENLDRIAKKANDDDAAKQRIYVTNQPVSQPQPAPSNKPAGWSEETHGYDYSRGPNGEVVKTPSRTRIGKDGSKEE